MIDQMVEERGMEMQNVISRFQNELMNIRTGRMLPAMFENIQVNLYGSSMPLQQLCKFQTESSKTLIIKPFDSKNIPEIEKVLRNSDLGASPVVSGDIIRITSQPLTQERREELVKSVKVLAERSKIAIRELRRDANNKVKKSFKDKELSEDDKKKAENTFQKMTDKNIEEIDKIFNAKSKELTTI